MINYYSFIIKFIPKFIKLFLKNIYYNLTGNFITKKIKGNKEDYLKVFNSIKDKEYKIINNFIKKNYLKDIDKKFLNDLAFISQISIKESEVNFQHGRLIYSLLDMYIKNLKSRLDNFLFVDVGTAKGFSSIVISKCACDNNINFKVLSFDIIPHNKKIFWNSVKDVDGKLSRENLLIDYSDYTKKINYIQGRTKKKLNMISKDERINFAFLDGSHDYDDVKFEFDFIKQKQIKGDIIFFDDVTEGHFNGVVKLINEITHQKSYEIEKVMSTKFRGYAIAKKII